METIDFNQVIKDNISVVGGLLPLASYAENGLLPKEKSSQMTYTTASGYYKIAKFKKGWGYYGCFIEVKAQHVLLGKTNNKSFTIIAIFHRTHAQGGKATAFDILGDNKSTKAYFDPSTGDIYLYSNQDYYISFVVEGVVGTVTIYPFEYYAELDVSNMTELV